MSLPNQVVMPADNAPNPATIPGTGRIYRCSAGASITVNGDDANVLKLMGWIGSSLGTPLGAGPTTGRPTNVAIGQTYHDTTVGALIIFAGPKTGWLHHSTGASA